MTMMNDFGATQDINKNVRDLVELLRFRAFHQPQRRAFTFLVDGERQIDLSYEELEFRARAIAARLQKRLLAGQRALLLYPAGLDFIAAFFGCLYAGVIAVPAYLPRLNRSLRSLQCIINDARPAVALTSSAWLSRFVAAGPRSVPRLTLPWITTDDIESDADPNWKRPLIDPQSVAFLQYTSGSTAEPKGVMVSHANLLHNLQMIARVFQQSAQSVIVGWLPLYHDMGLIGNVMQPLYLGAQCILLSPFSFMQRPISWLSAISRYGATTSGGPNFAYELCVRKTSEAERESLDLSSWEVAFNGAEPLHAETLERFAAAFLPYGFRSSAFYPCYGLAEATLLVSGAKRAGSGEPTIKSFEGEALARHRVVEIEAKLQTAGARQLVGCGLPQMEAQVLIVEPETGRTCGSDQVGEVWVSGEGVAAGYWNRHEESQQMFRAELAGSTTRERRKYLRTGDLGFLLEGELFISGRIKEMIILRGLNYYPQEIEQTVQRSVAQRVRGSVVAFGVERGGQEVLIIVAEVARGIGEVELQEVVREIREAVMEEHEVVVDGVALVRVGELEKTSSGKMRRHATRERYERGMLKVEAEWRAPWNEGESDLELDRRITLVGEQESGESGSAAEEWGGKKTGPVGDNSKEEDVGGRTSKQLEVAEWLRGLLSRWLGLPVTQIDERAAITRYGVDSLKAIELMHEVEKRWGVCLPMVSVLDSATVADFAHQVSEAMAATVADTLTTSRAVKGVEVGEQQYPLSYGQRGLWYLQQSSTDSGLYNLASAMRLNSGLKIDALREAFQSVIEQHEALRSTFHVVDGDVVQRVAKQMTISIDEEDASRYSEVELQEVLGAEAYRGFELQAGPLVRVRVFRRGASGKDVLLVVVHHLVADFWSLALLVEQLGKSYAEKRGGRREAEREMGSEPVRGYRKYVLWQREEVAGARGERDRRYWLERLSGELPVLEISRDMVRPAVQSHRGATEVWQMGRQLTERIRRLGQRQGATLYMTLLAAFQVLLHRYSGQEDILIASPTAGRHSVEFADVVGYFVNPVIIRADCFGNPTFSEFLNQIRQRVLEAFEHQGYPFPLLVEHLQPRRDPSRPPLAQVMFALQKAQQGKEEALISLALNEAGPTIEVGGLELEQVPLKRQVAMFDLTLMMAERDGRLIGSLKYNTDLFDAGTISRMATQYQTLLKAIVTEPGQRLSTLPLLEEADRCHLLEWNIRTADSSQGKTINKVFEEQAARTPDAVAVVYKQEQLTYAQLNSKANQLAHHLRSLGLRPEGRVGICLERSVEMITAWLGILKAGGAYVPLEPAYPKGLLGFMLQAADVRVLLTQQRLIERVTNHDSQVVCLDSGWNTIAREQATNPLNEAQPDNLAYVIYTSGSTGEPKGVMVSHQSVLNLLTELQHAIYGRYQNGSLRVGLNASLVFDASVKQLIVLLMGHSLYIVPDEIRNEGRSFVSFMQRKTLNVLDCTPSHLELLIDAGFLQGMKKHSATILVGGEPINVQLWQRMLEAKEITFYNLYGPTECTVDATACEVRLSPAKPSIGRPLVNVRTYLLDCELQPVPIGVSGELHIAGPGLARGYLERPALTAERFIPNPFSQEPGARLYKTGDLACYLPDGNIRFLERIDQQVKLRGFRIELGEIEVNLCAHADIRTAVVIVRLEKSGERRLVAYLVPERGYAPDVNQLRRFLIDRLPSYMVPAAFVILESLPLTVRGKIDRDALPAPDYDRAGIAEPLVAPRNSVEEVLARIFAQVLGLAEVGIYDNFFELGGHSLMATQLTSQLEDILPTATPLLTLFFEDPTVAGLATHISHDLGEGGVEKITEVLDRMGRLSDIEVEAMLSEQELSDVPNFGLRGSEL
jgi:amino acid adenylation domain-containing protein